MKEVGVRLRVAAAGLENVQALSKELNSVGLETTALDSKAAELAAELKRLAAEQGLIDNFKRQKQAVADAAAAMEAAKNKASALGREIGATEEPTKRQEAAFVKARVAARQADDAYTAQQLALQTLRGQMSSAGVATDALAAAQVRVHTQTEATKNAVQAAAGAAQTLLTSHREAAAAADALAAAEARARAETAAVATAGRQATAALEAHFAAVTKDAAGLRDQAAAAAKAGGQLDGLGGQLRSLAGIGVAGILGSQTVQLLKGVTETADAFANLQSRIKLVTGDGQAFQSAMAGIADVALRTNSNLAATGTLFSKLAQTGKDAGLGAQQAIDQALQLTTTINQAVQLSSASAEASGAAVTQLIQGLQSGVLRGDEFNSVMEQAPRLAQALAAGLGVTTGELRKMAEAGDLSASTVIKSLQTQSGVLQKEFGSLPATVGRAIENLNTKWTLFVGNLNASNGATGSVAAGINAIADNLDKVADVAGRAGAVLVAALAVQGVVALRAFAVQMVATGAAAALLSADLAKIPKTINIAVAAVGFEVGFRIGEMLTENSALARKLGVSMVAFYEGVVNGLQLLKEAAAAIFTSDTVEAAFNRFQDRSAKLRVNLQELWQDAEKSPAAVRDAARVASEEAQALGVKATAAGTAVAGAGAAGAAGMAATGAAAANAKAAIAGLIDTTKTASRDMSILGTTAAQQAEALVKVALAGRKAADALRTELPEAISKLAGPELESFRVAMTQALGQAVDQAKRLAEELGSGSTKGVIALGRAEQASKLLATTLAAVGAQAATSLGVDVATASAKVSAEFVLANQSLATLINSLPALKAAGVDTATVVAQALAKMIDGAKNQAELDEIDRRIKALGTTGQISGQQVAGAFDLSKDKALDLKKALEDATPGVQSLAEAARKAGFETGLLTTGLRKGFEDGLKPVQDLVEQLIKTGVEAEKASPVLAETLNKQVEAAKTKEELALVRAEILRARDAGKLFGSDFTRALGEVDAKIAALSPAMRQAAADAKRLGIELRDSIQGGADGGVEGAIRAYERLKASGKASASEIGNAFVNAANEAIKANAGMVPEWVKVEAAIRGATIEVDNQGRASVRAADAAKKAAASFGQVSGEEDKLRVATERSTGALEGQTGAFDKLGHHAGKSAAELQKYIDKYGSLLSVLERNKYDDQKFALGPDGQRFTAGGGKDPELTGGALQKAVQAYLLAQDRYTNFEQYNLTTGVTPTVTQARRRAAGESAQAAFLAVQEAQKADDEARKVATAARTVAAGSARSAGAATSAAAGPYSVYVDLGGGRSVQVGTSSPVEADKLAGLLAQIKADMARAGG